MHIIIEITLGKLIWIILGSILVGAILGIATLALCGKKEPPPVSLHKPESHDDDDDDGYYEV